MSEIIKVGRDVDFYMEWSTVVDGPTAAGTRAEMLDYLPPSDSPHGAPEARLARADETGSSSRVDPATRWDAAGLECASPAGWLPRERFEAFARAAASGDEDVMWAQLDPLGNADSDTFVRTFDDEPAP